MHRILSIIGIEISAVSTKEKVVSALGGLFAILVLILITRSSGIGSAAPTLIASMGASAVLLFAVPHGQLSQPWPVLAGHGFSALIGVFCYRFIPVHALAGGAAVALAILMMHTLKCIHPPGGATALLAVIGNDSIHRMGFQFVWTPVLTNGLALVALAIAFNWAFPWRRYPAALARREIAPEPHASEEEATHADVMKALESLDSFVDITEEDLLLLSRGIARERARRLRAAERASGPII